MQGLIMTEIAVTEFKDIHKGERCFICGTGPSINETPLHLLKDEIVWGVNTFHNANVKCKYYGVSDHHVWNANYKQIRLLDTTLFIGGGAEHITNEQPDKYLQHLKCDYVKLKIHPSTFLPDVEHNPDILDLDLTNGIYFTGSVVFDIGTQLAMYMGFDKVYLLGCDDSYSKVDNEYHFDGSKVHARCLPTLALRQRCYISTKHIWDQAGRKIYNATVGGKLEVFERVNLKDLF